MALRIANAYKTVSSKAAMVVNGIIPIHLVIKRAHIERAKTNGRDMNIERKDNRENALENFKQNRM